MYSRPVNTSRQRPSAKSSTAVYSFPAAVAGWVSNQNLAEPAPTPQGAVVLENIFPTATGGIVRRGSETYATLGLGAGPTTALFSYNNGNNRRLFGSDANTVYDITVVAASINILLADEDDDLLVTDEGEEIGLFSTVGQESIEGLAGGRWIDTQFATTGGIYLVIVNGTDPEYIFDGTRWFPIDQYGVYTLAFDAETAAFEVGQTVTGGTSGATGNIVYVDSDGSVGTLYLSESDGAFTNDETITSSTGSATVNGTATAYYIGIEGVDTDKLDYVWVYKNRLFYVERDSMNAWYLPVDQVGGDAEVFPLGGEFTEGGKLLFGAAWSLDSSGSGGLSEQCVFISDQGQVVVYQGLSPDSDDWSKVGTYKIGRPKGPKAWFRAGGDLIIATDVGDIPLSQAIQRDYAALSPAAVSAPIETAWNEYVSARNSATWDQIIWPERQMVLIALPTVNEQPPEMIAANARTGAWAKFTNWDGTCLEVFNGRLFFGSVEGKIVEGYIGGLDQGEPYACTYVPLFTDLGNPAARKVAMIARAVTRGPYEINAKLSVMEDYIVNLPSPPSASSPPPGSRWDVGVWGEAAWGESATVSVQQHWTSVSGYGYAMAPALQITSGAITPLDTEIVRLDITYETADIVT